MNEKLKSISFSIFMYIKNILNALSFQAKLIISIIFGISILVTLCAFLLIQNAQTHIDKEVIRLNHNLKLSQILSQAGANSLILDYDNNKSRTKRLENIANDFLSKHDNISFVVFTDLTGNILYKSQHTELYEIINNKTNKLPPPQHVPFIQVQDTKAGKLLILAEPIQFNSNLLGWAWLGIRDIGFTIVGSSKELFIFLLEIFILVWLLSVIGAIVNSLIIIRPLKKLEKSAKAISEGRFGFQLPLKGFLGRELTQLVKAFNKMSKRLKQYEESNIAILSSERNKFESVLMSSADGVLVSDKEDLIQIINPQAAKLLDKSSDELMEQKITSIWNEKVNKQISSYLENTRTTDHPTIEHTTLDLIQGKRNLKLLITPLYSLNNEHMGTVLVIQDRTKEAEIELLKQEFISNVSHELRTPITSIKCYVDTLCSHNQAIDEKTKNEFLSIVNEETDRLSHLVNDVLELSRLDSPSAKIQLMLQDIYPSIEYALKATKVLAEKKHIKLLTDIDKNLPQLYINQENIERVLINIISNAIKYTPGNGIVKVIAKRENKNVSLKVIDNGIGIEEEHLKLIFERFYRVENKVHTVKGTGLGLTIVKKSIEQHGGNITVKSKFGEGTIFEFTLPVPFSHTDEEEKIAAQIA